MFAKDVAACIVAEKPTLFRRLIVFAGSFDPFALHHREIVEQLVKLKYWMTYIDLDVPVEIVVWPIGAYATKQQATPAHARAAMLAHGLSGLDVTLHMDDLRHDDCGYTSTYEMQVKFSAAPSEVLRHQYFVPHHMPLVLTEVWHVIGADNIGEIKLWNEGFQLWRQARFIVLTRPGYKVAELPPKSILLEFETPQNASCTNIRKLIAAKQPWEHLVPRTVAACIKENGLYQPTTTKGSTT